MQSQPNPIRKSKRRRKPELVIDEKFIEEYNLSDLSMAFTQFDKSVRYSCMLFQVLLNNVALL